VLGAFVHHAINLSDSISATVKFGAGPFEFKPTSLNYKVWLGVRNRLHPIVVETFPEGGNGDIQGSFSVKDSLYLS
jgi:hypothetical protein